jgi:YVTN family beta-propeller protein
LAISCAATQQPQRPKKPGVASPNVRIAIEKLVPDAVFEIPGAPDWIAIDEQVWVSNAPKNSVARLDPKTNQVQAMIAVGKEPGSGLAAGFGSLWVPNCGDSTLSRVDLSSGQVTATIPMTIADSEGGIAVGAGVLDHDRRPQHAARIDPSNKIVAEIRHQDRSTSLARRTCSSRAPRKVS